MDTSAKLKNIQSTIEQILEKFNEVRYIAIYQNNQLFSKQKNALSESSSSVSDKYEELLVNPTLLTLTTQRGNIDCGGLKFLIVGYGNFFQLIKPIKNGHISICLDKNSNLTDLPNHIFESILLE